MVGAIILARRDLIPESKHTEVYTTSLTLPEKPRDLISTGNEE